MAEGPNVPSAMPLQFAPGLQRDGSPMSSASCIDGEWVRWYRGLPKKMGGFKQIVFGLGDTKQNSAYNSYRTAGKLLGLVQGAENSQMYALMEAGIYLFEKSSTTRGVWDIYKVHEYAHQEKVYADCFLSFDVGLTQWANNEPNIHAGTDPPVVCPVFLPVTWRLEYSESVTLGHVFYMVTVKNVMATPNVKLEPFFQENLHNGNVLARGGIICCPPCVIIYGLHGTMRWNSEYDLGQNNFHDTSYFLSFANQTIMKMMRSRGSSSPQMLAWTANGLYSVVYVPDGHTPNFTATTLEESTSLIAPQSVIECNQQFFWIGADQFYVFNGVVQTLTNTQNSNFFFDDLDPERAASIWSLYSPKYKEIWWVYVSKNRYAKDADPSTGTNPNHAFDSAVILNIESQCWYNTKFPNGQNRSCGFVMSTGEVFMGDANGNIYQHEVDVDEISNGGENGNVPKPPVKIKSSFRTPWMALFSQNPSANVWTSLTRIEPDLNQKGNMTVKAYAKPYAQSKDIITTGPFTFGEDTGRVDDVIKQQGRYISLEFTSDVLGGDYFLGNTILNVKSGDIKS